ncbi:MAG: LuxR C-terminal-related transcriptional regulator, partial [Candidatus Gastranaerophilales bacterium]|nr:LuxR C-terminal-related transcriptional regulator [Candidatus Gastranaerophilales bacterium]
KYCLKIELNEDSYKKLMNMYFTQPDFSGNKDINLKLSEMTENFNQREIMILKEISKSKTNSQIADKMNLSKHTIKKYVSDIFKKLQVTNRIEAIKKAKSENLIDF